jgi:hypothetical protein
LNEWFLRIPPEIQARAYGAGNEFAWPREDAIQVIAAIKSHFVVVGVEVWLPTTPGPTIPTPFVYQWGAGPSDAKNAAEYIRTFEWDDADTHHRSFEPYFNLTIVSCDA